MVSPRSRSRARPGPIQFGLYVGNGQGVSQSYAEAISGTASLPTREMPTPNTASASGTITAKAYKNYGEAMKWFRLAAGQGHTGASYTLGAMYNLAQGVPQNYAEGLKWIRLAADRGNAKGQFNLGVMYEHGDGVAQNYGEALKWYQLAANQGDALAQLNLGVMSRDGEGGRRTMPRPSNGFASPPTRAWPWRNSTSN